MAPDIDLILGDGWLRRRSATIDYGAQSVILRDDLHDRFLTLRMATPLAPPHPPPPAAGAPAPGSSPDHSPPSLPLLNYLQTKRALRKRCQAFLAVIRPTDPLDPEPDAPDHSEGDPVIAPPASSDQADPERIQRILDRFPDVFQDSLPGLPPRRPEDVSISLIPDAAPVNRAMFWYSHPELEEMKSQLQYLTERQLIRPSSSPWGFPVLFVRKANGTLRMCVDYRALNKLTVHNRYPIPRIDDMLNMLAGARVFSSLDLMQGYYQVRIQDQDCPKTAFKTPFGSYEFRVLPFGLTNAPAVFQSMMNRIFGPFLGQFVLVYLDDILIFSRSAEEHEAHLAQVLAKLREHKLVARLEKCRFNAASLQYLGHIVSAEGIRVNPAKVAAVRDWPRPRTPRQVRQFLGLANYFRKFLHGFSHMVGPLVALTREKHAFCWGNSEQAAFEWVKEALTSAPLLRMPVFSRPFEVVADASGYALGAALLQDGQPIAFESRKLGKAEVNYSATERELLAVVHALRVWHCFLEGASFRVVTDHCPLTYLKSQASLTSRQARWSEFLQQYDFAWEYRPGRLNCADPLSRHPALDPVE